jgi:hypothetical protein
MAGLRVLITNNALAERKGTELYVRDVAEALLKRGHSPIVYSTELGAVAAEIRSATVPVVGDLKSISSPPDIIHGHHHLETMTALLRFPGVPAIYFCHGWAPWEESPPTFSRIVRYVAVDETCRDRLVCEHGVPEDRVTTLLNFINLDMFPQRPLLPEKPTCALVLSNNATRQNYLRAVVEACGRAGISVDCIGAGVNSVSDRPAETISRYDIVFAKARSALEAMAVGAAVVLCDEAGLGTMVDSENFDRLRAINFGIRALRDPITSDALLNQINRYDAADAARVSQTARETAGIDSAIQQILSIYASAIEEFHRQPASDDLAGELVQAADYVRWISPHIKDMRRLAFELNKALVEQSTKYSSSVSAEQVQDMAERLKATEAEVAGIKRTLGWRLLSSYGIIKHRYLLAAYGRLRRSGQRGDATG